MNTGNSVADQGERDYNHRGVCPVCKRELILADALAPCEIMAKKSDWDISECQHAESCSKCEHFNPVFLCYCGYEFQEE